MRSLHLLVVVAFIALMPRAAHAQTVMPPALKVTWTPDALAKECARIEEVADIALAALVALPADKRSFDDTFWRFDEVVTGYQEEAWRLSFMKEIHSNAKVRDAAAACDERSTKYLVGLSARKDLYGVLSAAAATITPKDDDEKRLIDITLLDFKKSGVQLPDDKLTRLIAVRARLAELQTSYQRNLNEDNSTFTVDVAALDGMPKAFIDAHKDSKQPGKAVLSTKYPDYYPVMEGSPNEALRRQMELAFMQRGGVDNPKLLDEAITLRAEAAALLGYATHADTVAADRMAKDQATIKAFLSRVQTGLKPLFTSEVDALQKLKGGAINAWDWRYYLRKQREAEHNLDDDLVKRHFPTQTVIDGMFALYGELFGITLEPVKGFKGWADGVALYEVKDKASKTAIARFYVDMYPREGKYGHAAEFTLSSGQRLRNGTYRAPMCALVMNVTPARKGAPSYLSFKEVETLFHEFGHVMHETLTTARFASLSGTRTALDFVEAPSQMLENWVYEPAVLARISRDPNAPKKPMSAELAQKLRNARNAGAGVLMTRQVFLATFDQRIHTVKPGEKVDSVKVGKQTWRDVLGFADDDGTRFAGGFGHMMGGYDAGYYGYLWSEVFAADMFTRFEREGAMNAAAGKAYRDEILANGKTKDPGALLQRFLGREPNEQAFLQSLGIAKQAP